VHGKDQWHLAREFSERRDQGGQRRRVVHVGRAVQGHQPIPARLEPVPSDRVALLGPLEVGDERVDHHVADQVDLVGAVPLGLEVGHGVVAGGEEVVADTIRDDPVDLFWHGPVATAQSSFDVGNLDPCLRGDEGTTERRVHIAHHDDHVRGEFAQHRLEGGHDACRLFGVGP
jgi:hypothetical protein